jgi:hypothetical protein
MTLRARVSPLLRLGFLFGMALAIGALLAPLPAEAQADPVFCVYRRTVFPTPTTPSFEFTVARCDQGLGGEWSEIDRNLTFAAADAERTALSAGNAPPVFCVYVRAINIVPTMPSREFTVARCDQAIGAEWVPVPGEQNVSFAAASAARDGLNAANAPTVFCLLQRTIFIVPNTPSREFTVARCDQAIGAEWTPVPGEQNLTFAAASAARDGLNAANTPAIWCVLRRGIPIGARTAIQFTVARCDVALGDGWEKVDGPLTFVAASVIRDAGNAAAGDAVWCVFRRTVLRAGAPPVTEFTVSICDQVPAGWTNLDGPETFAAAVTEQETLAGAALPPAPGSPPGLAGGSAPGDALGVQWNEQEYDTLQSHSTDLYTGTWTRTAGTNSWNGDFTGPGGSGSRVFEITLSGNTVNVVRRNGDTVECTYTGILAGQTVTGTYSCPGAGTERGTSSWSARITR